MLVVALAVTVLLVGAAVVPASTASAAETECPAAILPDREVTVMSGDIPLAGSYRGPADPSAGLVPAAVIIGGTGAIDRNGNIATIPMEEYRWLADLLSAQGIASIRYDKLGTGATGLGPFASDPAAMLPLSYDELRVQPARDAMSFLASQPGIDATRLIVIGHSEGGAVALMIVDDPGSAPAPAGLALIEPAYTHILDVLTRQLADQMVTAVADATMTSGDAATLTSWMLAGVDEIRFGSAPFPPPGPLPVPGATGFTSDMQLTIAGNIYGTDPAEMVITHAFRTLYGQGYDDIDPATLAQAVTIPTLITCGARDFNTPCGDGSPASGVLALANAFPPGVARFVELPGTVHILRDIGDDEAPTFTDQIAYPFSTVLDGEFSAFVGGFR